MFIIVAYVVHVTNSANSNSFPSRRTNIFNCLYRLNGCCVASSGCSLMASSSTTVFIIQPHWIRWISRLSINTPRDTRSLDSITTLTTNIWMGLSRRFIRQTTQSQTTNYRTNYYKSFQCLYTDYVLHNTCIII